VTVQGFRSSALPPVAEAPGLIEEETSAGPEKAKDDHLSSYWLWERFPAAIIQTDKVNRGWKPLPRTINQHFVIQPENGNPDRVLAVNSILDLNLKSR
jgi:hypothetical protein